MPESPIVARPAEPFADAKARAAAAVEAARDELIDLSHRIHANPEPAFEEHQAAAWCAEVIARHGFAVEHPAGTPRDRGPRPADRRQGPGRAADRRPRRVRRAARVSATAAATTRWRPRASVPRSRWRPSATRGRARSSSSARRRRSGGAARRSCCATACSRAWTPRCCTTPATATTSRSRRSRRRTSTSCSAGLQSRTRRREPWEGRNALDAMIALFVSVGLWRQQLPPHCRVHGIISGGRHGRQHHPGPHARLVHDPQRRPGLLRRRR